MKLLAALTIPTTLLLLAGPALAAPETEGEICTPILAILDPNPLSTCVGYDYEAVNDVCVTFAASEVCIRFIGPVID